MFMCRAGGFCRLSLIITGGYQGTGETRDVVGFGWKVTGDKGSEAVCHSASQLHYSCPGEAA